MESASGPGYCTPLEAMKGPKEKLIYVTCVQPYPKETRKPDFLATVNVNPDSHDYCKIIHYLEMPNVGDELHHTGWNACSSCHDKPHVKRNRLIMPCLNSDRVYVVDTGTNPTAPSIFKVVEGKSLHDKTNTSAPHTSHCLPSGEVMISTMGDKLGNAKGSFILLDGKTFELTGVWPQSNESAKFGYDYWYQLRFNVMISSEWGAPNSFRKGFHLSDIANGQYGHSLNVWNWKDKSLIQTIDLGPNGMLPLEVRFLHNPERAEGFVCCALSSTIFRFYKDSAGTWAADQVIAVPNETVSWWLLPQMPGIITDIVISLDDRYLYLSNWVQGDIRQYNIQDTSKPVLAGQIFLGGSLYKGGPVEITSGSNEQHSLRFIKGKPIRGGPQMLQLSLDGKRLYVTTSLFSAWDKQFYPETAKCGSMMLCIDVDTENGGLCLKDDFLVDFSHTQKGPALAHEMRYPGGDCTSDIWP